MNNPASGIIRLNSGDYCYLSVEGGRQVCDTYDEALAYWAADRVLGNPEPRPETVRYVLDLMARVGIGPGVSIYERVARLMDVAEPAAG